MEREFIGDGVTASFDGYQIWLSTPRENGEHRIALEPGVFAALVRYGYRIWAAGGEANDGN